MQQFFAIAIFIFLQQYLPNHNLVATMRPSSFQQQLPSPWKQADIGASHAKGSASFNGKQFILTGSGSFADGAADQCQYTWFQMDSVGELTVRVVPQPGQGPARMGLMMRESMAANAAQVSLMLTALKTPAGALEWRAVQFSRSLAGDILKLKNMSEPIEEPLVSAGKITGAYWLRLQRKFNSYYAFISADGKTWTSIGSSFVEMNYRFLAGIAVSSGAKDNAATVVFDNVRVPGWSSD